MEDLLIHQVQDQVVMVEVLAVEVQLEEQAALQLALEIVCQQLRLKETLVVEDLLVQVMEAQEEAVHLPLEAQLLVVVQMVHLEEMVQLLLLTQLQHQELVVAAEEEERVLEIILDLVVAALAEIFLVGMVEQEQLILVQGVVAVLADLELLVVVAVQV